MKNYYEILGIEENFNSEELKKKYRKLSKEFHPDVNPNGAERFKEISEAYEVLSDPQKKQQYDFQRQNPFGNQSSGMGGFEDLFSHMFGGANPFQNRRPTSPSKMVKLSITPIESFLGSEKNLSYKREKSCESCNGTGGDQQKCNGCNGSGFVIKTFGTGFMIQQVRTACDRCGGRGNILINRCNVCTGKGTKTINQEVKIKIPVGSDGGQFLKLQGYGDYTNGIVGDLVVQIEVEPHDNFEKINNDLVYNLYLDYNQLKNTSYMIPHPSGILSLNAPKLFDTSKPLRLKGKGYHGGDMYVKLHVKFQRD